MLNSTTNTPPKGKTDLKRTLKEIRGSADTLEVFAYSSLASMNGAYGDENDAYTQRRISDVLMMLERLQELHTELMHIMADTPANTRDPFTSLSARQVQTANDGYVTISNVMQATGCTERQARTAITKATEQGILIKTGEGGATRYRYAKQTPEVKQ